MSNQQIKQAYISGMSINQIVSRSGLTKGKVLKILGK